MYVWMHVCTDVWVDGWMYGCNNNKDILLQQELNMVHTLLKHLKHIKAYILTNS